MTVYIEYAFLENFLLDGILLTLSLKALKMPVRWKWIGIAALFGGIFAVVYPLLSLSPILEFCLKVAVGLLLPLIAFGKIKTRKEWGRYALSATLFFLFTFLFGGALLGGMANFSLSTLPWWVVVIFFALFTPILVFFIEKIYKRRAVERQICVCTLYFGEKEIKTCGFLDSGNMATKNALPVCFLSADIFYELFGDYILQGRGQVCDEMKITTMTGEENILLYKGYVAVDGEKRKCEAYFARSNNMIGREYKVLLHSRLGDTV